MSWFDHKIYTEEEVLTSGSEPVPANFQIGENVWVHIVNDKDQHAALNAFVAGITISDMHEIRYDLFFKIEGKFYVRVNGFRGYITKPGETIDEDGGLVDITHLDLKQKPILTLVKKLEE